MQLKVWWLCALSTVVATSGRHLRLSLRQTPVATDTIAGINEAIFRARERQDNIEIDCKWSEVKYHDLVTAAHARQFATDSKIGELRTKQSAFQTQYTESIATIDKVKLKRKEQMKLCARFKESGIEAAQNNKDGRNLAEVLSDIVQCPEGALVQEFWLKCHDGSNGNQTISFEDPKLQAKAANLTNQSYNNLQVALLAAFNSKSSASHGQPPKKAPPKCVIPKRAVDCSSLSDSMSRLKGLLEDQGERNGAQMAKISEKCDQKVQSIDRNIVRLNNIAKTASEGLVNLGKEIAAAERQQFIASKSHHDATEARDDRKDRCKNEVYDLGREICELQKRRADLLRIRGQSALVGDCEVSPWKPKGPCSAKCGGGKQFFTREILSKPMGGAACPKLEFERQCNTAPCPVDCKVGKWSPWTECSVSCGDGVVSKKREIITKPENNGSPCPSTVETKMCGGTTPCEAECQLGEWGPWKACTRACGGGKKTRTRGIAKQATGRFHCPKAGSKKRTDFQACNKDACPAKKDLKCSSKADLVMLLDGSGSITTEAFEQQKAFATDLSSRFTLNQGTGHLIAAVIYGDSATTVFPLTDDALAMRNGIAGLRRGKGGASLSSGLNKAKQLLGRSSRKDNATENIVFVMADGPADSEVLSLEASHELQSYGVRVVVTLVGEGMDTKPLEALASKPTKQNFFNAKSFEELQRDVQSRMIEICSSVTGR